MRKFLYRVTALVALILLTFIPLSAHAQEAEPGVTDDRVTAAITQLDGVVNDIMQKTGVPGVAVAVVYKDQVVYLKGFGVREVGKPDTVDGDTVFRLASISKPLAATTVAGLVGDGVVTWDDTIVSHDPSFALSDAYITEKVTVRDVFAHRSGLPDHIGDLAEDIGFDRATILHNLRFVALDNHFRSQYAYTNYGLTEGAVAAAMAAGKSWETLIHDRLYQPLDMNDSTSLYADFLTDTNRAAAHVQEDGKWVAKYEFSMDSQSPAGGAFSSAKDMAQWMRLQLGNGQVDGKQIVDANALAATHVAQIVSSPPADASVNRPVFYGLGWDITYDALGRVVLSHSGAIGRGGATEVRLLPGSQIGIITLTNGAPIGIPEAVDLTFMDLATYGKSQRDYYALTSQAFAALVAELTGSATAYSKPPENSDRNALPPQVYVGAYRNAFYGDIMITSDANGLTLELGPKPDPFPLKHYNRDTFTYLPTGEYGGTLSGVTFTIGADGLAESVVVEHLNDYGLGTFTRVAGK